MLLLSELSRLGRNVDEVLANIRFAKENRLNIYFQKEGISIYGADGKENPYLTIMIAVLGTCAQMERESIHYRLQSGRKVYVDKHIAETGKSGLGRKEGYRKPVETKKEEYKEVLKLLKAGYPGSTFYVEPILHQKCRFFAKEKRRKLLICSVLLILIFGSSGATRTI